MACQSCDGKAVHHIVLKSVSRLRFDLVRSGYVSGFTIPTPHEEEEAAENGFVERYLPRQLVKDGRVQFEDTGFRLLQKLICAVQYGTRRSLWQDDVLVAADPEPSLEAGDSENESRKRRFQKMFSGPNTPPIRWK